MNVIVDGSVINYQDNGHKQGKTILFLHGWADDGSTFRELIKSLDDKYRCISLDLPGFGNSDVPSATLGLPDFSSVVQKFLDKLEVSPEIIVAHSNGGAIAINATASGKVKPKKMILLASSGIRYKQKLKKTAYKIMAKPLKLGLMLLPKSRRSSVKKRLYGQIGSDYLVSESMKETFKKIVSYDVSKDATRISIPTLLIYGTDDDATPPEMGRELHGLIKDSKFEIIDGAAHFLHHDSTKKVAQRIGEFL